MPRQDEAQLKGEVPAPEAAAAEPPPVAPGCTCAEFRRNQVCDHVLMSAALRMVRRMIDIHAQSQKSR